MEKDINKEETDGVFKSMTDQLRLTCSDEQVADYLRWVIRSEIAEEYWKKRLASSEYLSKEELEVVFADVKHIWTQIDLSKEQRELRTNLLVKLAKRLDMQILFNRDDCDYFVLSKTYAKGQSVIYDKLTYIFDPNKKQSQFSVGRFPTEGYGWRIA